MKWYIRKLREGDHPWWKNNWGLFPHRWSKTVYIAPSWGKALYLMWELIERDSISPINHDKVQAITIWDKPVKYPKMLETKHRS